MGLFRWTAFCYVYQFRSGRIYLPGKGLQQRWHLERERYVYPHHNYATLVAHLVGADALVLLSDVDSLYTAHPSSLDARPIAIVDDLDDLYGQIDIVASPIRIGGGLKIKNIDALCRGKALVTTRVGAEGLEDGAGTAFVQADGAADFADALGRLIACAAERGALQQAAFAFASERFSEDAVFSELDATLADLAASRLA